MLKKNLIKFTALSLVFLMMISITLISCSKKEEAVKTKLTNVYKAEKLNAESPANGYYNRISYSNGFLYYTEDEYNDTGNFSVIKCFDTNTQTTKTLFRLKNDNGYMNNFYATAEGELIVIKYEYNTSSSTEEEIITYDKDVAVAKEIIPTGVAPVVDVAPVAEETISDDSYIATETTENYYIVKYKSDGTQIFKKNIRDIITTEQSYIYLYNLTIDDLGNILLFYEKTVYILDKDLNLLKKFDIDCNYLNNLYYSKSKYYVFYSDKENKSCFKSFDFTTGKLGETIDLKYASNFSYSLMTPPADSKYDFYYNNNSALCGLILTTGETTEICNWINSDINSNNVGTVIPLSDENFISLSYDTEENPDEYKQKIYYYTRVPDEQIVEKYILTIAAIYIDYNVRNQIIKFNKSNDEYKITINEYYQYNTENDYKNAYTIFNNDLIAGKIPDIIQLDREMPIDSYISKGIFYDLNNYFNDETGLKRSDYLENVLDALSVNGKLYRICPSFYIRTLVGKKSLIGDITGWTVNDLLKVLEKNPGTEPFFDMTQTNFLNEITTLVADQFINRDTGVCSFDSQEFIDLLNFIKTLPEKSYWDNYDYNDYDPDTWNNIEAGYRENKYLLQSAYFSNYRMYWEYKMGIFGEDVVIPGYPTANKEGSSINPSFELAITSTSKFKDGAWDFIKYFISDEYQSNINYEIPLKLSRLNDIAKENMKPYSYTDSEGNVIENPTTYWVAGQSIEIGEITQEYVDKFNDFIKSITNVSKYDSSMQTIISEETAAFFAGTKTAEETAKIINNRVSTYINESR